MKKPTFILQESFSLADEEARRAYIQRQLNRYIQRLRESGT